MNLKAVAIGLGWWILTIGTLVVLDDLTFGPIFWLIGAGIGGLGAAVIAWVIYFVVQLYLVRQGTNPEPGRLATWFLNRLSLQRRYEEVGRREQSIQARVAGVVSAVLISPVIGGVLPPLLLYKAGFPRVFVRHLTIITAAIYATEFAFLHGWLPQQVA